MIKMPINIAEDNFIICNAADTSRSVWKVLRVDNSGNPTQGEPFVTFNKKKIYNLFMDYPHNFSPKEKTIFDKAYPFWADFFADRISNKY